MLVYSRSSHRRSTLLPALLATAFAVVGAQPTTIPFTADANPLKLPAGRHFGEVTGVDVDARGHVFVFHRGGGRGEDLYGFAFAHTVRVDKQGNIYVGDRTNRRIQVIAPNGTLLRIMTIDVPYTKEPNVMVGAMPRAGANPLAVSGAPWGICITPGPTQYLYSVDAVPGRLYKLTPEGKVLGFLGEAGKAAGEFGWAHQIACPSENELYVGEILNWRVQKLTLRPTAAQR